jgi:leucyl aminopeptidase (aminopeptidase T)
MKNVAISVVRDCLNIKPSEKVLVLTDQKMLKIGRILYEASQQINLKTALFVMNPTSRNGEEPPEAVASLMKKNDVIIAVTYNSLSHTKARKEATEAGVRIASMPRVAEFSFTEGGLTADYSEVDKLCRKMNAAVKNSKEIHITSKKGTGIKLSVEGRKWKIDNGLYRKKGLWGTLPAGEIFTAPVEGTANGKIFFDQIGEYGKGIELKIENGLVKELKNSTKLEKILNELGKKSRILAEIGIGCNPKAKIIGNILEDEKVMGTVHIALGNNLEGGGSNYIQFHKDGVIAKPTLEVDRKMIIKEGKWVI